MAVVEEDEELLRLRPDGGENEETESRPRSAMSTYNEEVNEIMTKLKKVADTKNPEYQDNLRLFVQDWRDQTTKEMANLEKLKKRVQKRKVIRAEEDKLLGEMREREEELRLQEIEDAKLRKQAEKMRRIEVAETKRQKLLEESKEKKNYTIQTTGREQKCEEERREPTKEEIEAMKTAALSVRIKPLGIDGLHKERLKRRGAELWEALVKIESERYDLEERQRRQEYDLRELKERQKQQLRSRAMKLGLPPEALTGKYPPKIMVASKYERRAGLKPFGETKDLFEGGFKKQYQESQDKTWMDRQDLFTKKEKDQMPPWLEDMPRRTKLVDSEDEDDEEKVKKAQAAMVTQEQKEEEGGEEEAEEVVADEAEEEVEADVAAEEVEVDEDEEEVEVEEVQEEVEEVEEVEEAEEAEPPTPQDDPDVILEDPEGEAKAEAEQEIEEESEEEEEEDE